MMNRRWSWLTLLLCACCAHGAELARLTNGFSVRCEHHEENGGTTRLYLNAHDEGFVEILSERVSGYEPSLDEPPQAAAQAPTLPEHIASAGLQTGIDPDFINSVIRAESGYNARAVSPKGAQGLMQLMPATAARLGVHDSFDPADNLDGGSRYLRELLLRYNGDAIKALAAYNAGPESVEKYKGVPPYRETRSYVARVINDFNRRKLAASKPPVDSKLSKHTVGGTKADSKPARTGGNRNAASKEAQTGHSAKKRDNQTTRVDGRDSARAVALSARNQLR
jgi:hypothetical protein